MSNQVYGNTPALPNKIISELLTATAPGGEIIVPGVFITGVPTTRNTNAPFLVRNPNTGAVEQRDSSTVPHAGETQRNKTVNQAMADSTETGILFDDEVQNDPALVYNAGNGAFTVAAGYSGQFTVAWTLSWAANNVASRWTWLTIDASPARYGSTNVLAGAFDQAISTSVELTLAAGESFSIVGFQNSGGPLDVLGSTTNGVDFASMTASRTSIAGFQ